MAIPHDLQIPLVGVPCGCNAILQPQRRLGIRRRRLGGTNRYYCPCGIICTRRSQAHVALQVGDELVWESQIPIPSEAEIYRPTWTNDEAVPKETPIYFHLHNHGANSWRLLEIVLR